MYYLKSLAYILNRYVLGKKYLIGHSPKYGISLKFKTQDGGGRAIYKKGLYEEDLTGFLLNYLKFDDDDVIIDIGANIGWYSVIFSTQFNTDCKIVCFEPDPDNFNCLKHNLDLNNASNVEAIQKGISDKTETKTLYLYKDSNIGRHSMLNINEGPTIDVETLNLDEFLADQNFDLDKVKFLKIDIEGFEYFAFKGASKLLQKLPCILAEFSPGYMRKGGVEPKELLDLLRSNNFIPHAIENGELKEIDDETLLERNSNINLFWTKSI